MRFVVFVFLLFVTEASCSTIRGDAATGIGAMIDCEQSGIASTVTELLSLAKTAILSTISGDGKHVDTAALKAAASGLKSNAARCAFASAVAILAKPIAPKPGAPAAAALEIDSGELRAAFESVRGQLGGVSYKTSAGVI